jgi:hypothetical protein
MRYVFLIIAFAAGSACGLAGPTLTARLQGGSAVIEPGNEFLAILKDEVMSVTFRTGHMTFSAQRSMPGAVFAVQVTYADGRVPQQCKVSSDLAGQLGAYSTFTAKRQLQSQQQAQRDFPVQVGTLELRDRVGAEPAIEIQLRTNSDRKALAALYENVAVEVINSEHAFTSLEKGCDFLAERVVH